MKETFKAARERLFSELDAAGWKLNTFNYSTMKPLVVPYATRGRTKLWFKSQAVYAASGPGVTFGNARSISSDVRGVTATEIERLLKHYGHES